MFYSDLLSTRIEATSHVPNYVQRTMTQYLAHPIRVLIVIRTECLLLLFKSFDYLVTFGIPFQLPDK